MVEKSEEKIFRRGYYPLDLWAAKGGVGVLHEKILQIVLVYIINFITFAL